MPYYIESDNPECENWATVKEDGEIMGCHLTKQDAIDQMVALSIGEDIDPGGERDSRDGWQPNEVDGNYLEDELDPESARERFVTETEQQEERSETMNATMEKRDTDNLVRHLRFDVSPNEDGLTLDGYGAVFNEFTEIEDAVGVYREQIAPGAFKRTLGMRTPILQFDHGSHPLIGSIPLGRILSLVEDEHGLRVKARLSDNWLVQPVRDAIRDGGVSGMSFRFRIVDEDWVRAADGMEERTIREVELYEVGPVVFPAYEQTSVGVRSRDVLDALEDATVRGEVAHILARGGDLSSLPEQDDPDSLHSSDDETSAPSHVSTRSINQRRAIRRIAGI